MARQKLGQHFLASGKALQRIALASKPSGCEGRAPLAVEIGPGKGALTQYLLGLFERVIVIELDPLLAQHVRERWHGEPRLEVVEKNALDADWRTWGGGVLVGNLPYYVSTSIISKYVLGPGFLGPATFLIQKEVAERITATPGHREYGYFSVECQLLTQAEYLFNVPPGAFAPPPKVDSAVVRLTPVAPPAGLDVKRFLHFASACFRQKRKTLRNNLSERFPRATLDLRPEMGLRAEQLSVTAFLELYRALCPETTTAALTLSDHPSL